jgi:hypothetical protein
MVPLQHLLGASFDGLYHFKNTGHSPVNSEHAVKMTAGTLLWYPAFKAMPFIMFSAALGPQ